jgi:hypothetical protein
MSRASQGLIAPLSEAHETRASSASNRPGREMHAGNRLVPEPAVDGGAEG